MVGDSEKRMYLYMKRASVPVLGLALLLHLISFGAPYWGVTNHRTVRNDHIGLWKYCSSAITSISGRGSNAVASYKDHCTDYIDIDQHDWQMVSQAFMTLALFSLLACLGLFAAYSFSADFQLNIKMFLACCMMALLTVLLVCIALASWSSMYADWFTKLDDAYGPGVASLGWAFYLAIVVAILVISAPVLVIPDTYLKLREEEVLEKDPRLPYNL